MTLIYCAWSAVKVDKQEPFCPRSPQEKHASISCLIVVGTFISTTLHTLPRPDHR